MPCRYETKNTNKQDIKGKNNKNGKLMKCKRQNM